MEADGEANSAQPAYCRLAPGGNCPLTDHPSDCWRPVVPRTIVAEEVRKLADESKNAILHISGNIDDIIRKIKNNYSSTEGISGVSEEQTASMEEITATANKLGALAEKLKERLGQSVR